MSEPPQCPLCDRPMIARFSSGEFTMMRCAACDLECAHPMPTPEALTAFYTHAYFDGSRPGHGYEDYFGRERAIADDKATTRMELLFRCGLREGDTLLELGAADGRVLLEAHRRGVQCVGVEASQHARTQADPVVRDALYESLDEALDRETNFECFAAFDVLEHLIDPVATLTQIRAKLALDALVAVVVPVTDNGNARWWPTSWDQYKPPEHLWYFSRASMRTLLAKTLGARMIEERSAWTRSSRVCDAWLGRRGTLARIEGRLWDALVQRKLVDPARIVDSVLFVARREVSAM
ncbi:MAG: class I SAM-dependent methyltransferase [Deltaproteobacteria bacterium]|nr:class I SAM-dependent methyltransferase [Deltaproteobacteria bacterium]